MADWRPYEQSDAREDPCCPRTPRMGFRCQDVRGTRKKVARQRTRRPYRDQRRCASDAGANETSSAESAEAEKARRCGVEERLRRRLGGDRKSFRPGARESPRAGSTRAPAVARLSGRSKTF